MISAVTKLSVPLPESRRLWTGTSISEVPDSQLDEAPSTVEFVELVPLVGTTVAMKEEMLELKPISLGRGTAVVLSGGAMLAVMKIKEVCTEALQIVVNIPDALL